MSRAECWQPPALLFAALIMHVAGTRRAQDFVSQRGLAAGALVGSGVVDTDAEAIATKAAPIRIAMFVMFPR